MNCTLKRQIINTYSTDYKFFFSKPNVKGFGYGYKYVNGIRTCEPCIIVFVEKKMASNCLPSNGLIPPLYKGIKTDVIQTGTFNADYCKNVDSFNICNSMICNNINGGVYIKRVRPLEPGYCVSISEEMSPIVPPTTGTIGYIVTDNAQVSKTFCFLSTNTTFADTNDAPIGTDIIQPSTEFKGEDPEDVIAKLLRFIVIKFDNKVPNSLRDFNTVDGAVASFVNVGEINLIDPRIPVIGVPIGIRKPEVDETIQWTGCMSGYQQGIILSESTMIDVNYGGTSKKAYFKDIMVSMIDKKISSLGDRGALVCDLAKNAIGLMFANNNDPFFPLNIICSINNLQDQLNITLVTAKS